VTCHVLAHCARLRAATSFCKYILTIIRSYLPLQSLLSARRGAPLLLVHIYTRVSQWKGIDSYSHKRNRTVTYRTVCKTSHSVVILKYSSQHQCSIFIKSCSGKHRIRTACQKQLIHSSSSKSHLLKSLTSGVTFFLPSLQASMHELSSSMLDFPMLQFHPAVCGIEAQTKKRGFKHPQNNTL
jgi:hypothetical protein